MSLIDDFKKPLGISFPDNRKGFYHMAMSYTKNDYDWAEFGVYKGITAKIWLGPSFGGPDNGVGNGVPFTHHLPLDKKLYLFDSFEGLPEDWAGVNNYGEERFSPKGTFALDNIPKFDDDRVVLQVGWKIPFLPL